MSEPAQPSASLPAGAAQASPSLLTLCIAQPDERSKRMDQLFIGIALCLLAGFAYFLIWKTWLQLSNYLAFAGSIGMGLPAARTMLALRRAPRSEAGLMTLDIAGKDRVMTAFQRARTVHFVNFSTLDLIYYMGGIVLLAAGYFLQLLVGTPS